MLSTAQLSSSQWQQVVCSDKPAATTPTRLRLWQHLQELGRQDAASACLVNGQPSTASRWICAQDNLQLQGQTLPAPLPRQYFICHKPVGVDCNVRQGQLDSIWLLLQQLPVGVFPVGRLDKDSCGLLLLTNDGPFANQLLHPSAMHQKTYQVAVDRALKPADLQQLQQGMHYQAGPNTTQARPCQVRLLAPDLLEIRLTEGKNRQIRYMLKTLGYRVLHLQRTAIGRLSVPTLGSGQWRALSAAELLQAREIPA